MAVSIKSTTRGSSFTVTAEVIDSGDDGPLIKVRRAFDGEDESDAEEWTLGLGFVWNRQLRDGIVSTDVGIKLMSASSLTYSIWGVEGTGSSAFEYWVYSISPEDAQKLRGIEDQLFARILAKPKQDGVPGQ